MKVDIPARSKAGLLERDALVHAAECLRTLAHPCRLRMVEIMLADRYTVGRLAERCGVVSHVASGHLRLMQRCGLLIQERKAAETYYRVGDPCLKDFIACIRRRFAGHEPEN